MSDNHNQEPLAPEVQRVLKRLAQQAGILDAIKQTNLLPSASDEWLNKYVTEDLDLIKMKGRIKILAEKDKPVLILGETGTGKEIIARALHGDRKGKFIAINLTALPNELIESELFGHAKGAFTGAVENRVGLMEEANGGTLFLDEIGDMPIAAQAKLLRALQDKQIRRVGDNMNIDIKNVRIVCATHCNLESMMEQGKFRADLYWRLQYYILRTKPLRERPDDIWEILDKVYDRDLLVPEYVREAWSKLEFRGNVRELEAKVERYHLFKEE